MDISGGSDMPRSVTTRGVDPVLLLTIFLAIFMTSVHTIAAEQLSIQTLLSQAPSYEHHDVTLQGVTRDMQVMPPLSLPNCSNRYRQATFTLDDGTGSLPVDVLGNCLPQAVAALPKDGDAVIVRAVIFVVTRELPALVRAQATDIRILDPK